MKHSLKELIELEYEKDRELEINDLFWEMVFNSRFDIDSAGDRD